MNQVATTPKPQIMVGGQVAALVPQSLDEAFRVANAIAASGLAPKGLEKPEQVLVSIMAGAELGLAPFQSLQSFAVVNGKPSLWGDAIPALLWSRGFALDEWFDDDDAPTKAFCKVTRPNGKEIERTFSVADAKKANLIGKSGPWQTNQKRMLQMRARAFAARDGASDVLRGLQVREEVDDYQPMRGAAPQQSGVMARLPGNTDGDGFGASNMDQLEHPRSPAALDAVLDDDDIPEFSSDGGPQPPAAVEGQPSEAGESPAPVDPSTAGSQSDDDFPGDRPSSSTKAAAGEVTDRQSAAEGGLTLAQRVDQLKARCTEAQTVLKLRAVGNNAAAVQLRKDLDAADPEELAALGEWFNEREIEMERLEREAKK